MSQEPKKIAITGTKGKTTILSLIEHGILSLSPEAKVISSSSTEGMFYNKKFIRQPNNKEYLSNFDSDGNNLVHDYFISEATSFMLYIGAYETHNPSIAIYTGIEENEHLDFHFNFKNYLNAKKVLFDLLSKNSIAIVNADDKYVDDILRDCKSNTIIKYGSYAEADYIISVEKVSYRSMKFSITHEKDSACFESKILGKYNAYNITAAYIALINMGFQKSKAAKYLSQFKGVPGRYERYYLPGNRIVIIDYAHTPGSLQKVIELTKKIYKGKKVVIIFGCGGDRAKEKRPLMGKCATESADFVYITSDNPRTENSSNIIENIKKGIIKNNYEVILDRKEAVIKAVKDNENAVIVLAGKGSEQVTNTSTFETTINCNHCGNDIKYKLDNPLTKIIKGSDLDLLKYASKELNIPIVENNFISSFVNS